MQYNRPEKRYLEFQWTVNGLFYTPNPPPQCVASLHVLLLVIAHAAINFIGSTKNY